MADQYLDKGNVINSTPEGDQRNKLSAVFDAFQNAFGRGPTQDELNEALPAFSTDNQPHVTNVAGGNAYVSQLHSTQENTPDKIAQKQQTQYLAEAPKHYDAVNQVFQSQLGRTATQDELDHFGSQIASGSLDPYQLQQFVQQQPEYQTTQNKNFQNGLATQLQGYDQNYFNTNVLPSIQEAYAKQGRSFDSSAFQNAATNSAQQQNVSRENFLANLSAQQYGNVQSNAYNDYANQVRNQQNLTNAGIQAQYAGVQNNLNRSNQLMDYQMQSDAYNNYLSKYGKRNNGLGGLIGGGLGAAVGGYFGGTAGAGLGYQLGSGTGTAIQNSGGSY